MNANVRYSQDRFLNMDQAMGNLVTILKENKESVAANVDGLPETFQLRTFGMERQMGGGGP